MLISYIESEKEKLLQDLQTFLSIPSISSQSDHNTDMQQCAEWIADHMRKIGMQKTQVFETEGHPIVYAEWIKDANHPTILFYGHYDVQPVDPVDLWTSPPFAPEVREGKLFARGAVDDKGQVFIQLKSMEAYLKRQGTLPVNVKMLIEGEEEIGSVHLTEFLKAHRDMLEADFALISDTSMFQKDYPSVCYGLRGLTFIEITVTGPSKDLHSGSFGGSVHNPIQALCEMIARLHDQNGSVTIPGFYEDVVPLSQTEQEAFRELPHSDESYVRELGVKALYGEKGFTTLERLWARPTLECNGIWGGYTGEGTKTVLPSKAYAKLSMRLVPDQRSDKIQRLASDHIKRIAPNTVEIQVDTLAGGEPVLTPIDSPWIKAIAAALEKGFGKKTVYQREGGSIPVVAELKKILNLDPVMVGFGLPDANAHAPDEHIHLENLFSGIYTLIHFYHDLPAYCHKGS